MLESVGVDAVGADEHEVVVEVGGGGGGDLEGFVAAGGWEGELVGWLVRGCMAISVGDGAEDVILCGEGSRIGQQSLTSDDSVR